MATLLEVLTGQGTAEEAPLLVLWLEDLQWSDAATLDLLAALARRREPARLLIIGTYRPVDVIVRGHSLREIRQELRRRHGNARTSRSLDSPRAP